MKQTTKNWFGAVALILGSSAVTGAVVRGTASSSQPLNSEPVATMPAVYRITLKEDGEVDHFCRYPYHGNTPDVIIHDIDGDGSAWLNIDGGLYRLREKDGKLVREEIDPAMQQLAGRFVTDVLKRQDVIWISTNDGLYAYNTTSKELSRLSHTIQSGSLSHNFTTCLGITPDNPCPTGEVNRVVQGVTIYEED